MGTKAPHAATMGASIRLTLSPTPPEECLSITGPGSPRLFHSSATPEPVIATVIATLSSVDMPRKNTAMAKAATWPSLRLPSWTPRTTKAISSAESSCPSRFRRMISWGSMDPTLLETAALLPGASGDRDPDLAQFGQRFLGIRVVVPGEEAEAQHGESGDA